ncbi:MAG: metalloregulator ArsR/SmtB family transcription factor [Pseudomonadota bacterium]
MAYAEILDALSDPTRRAIVEALRNTPLPVGTLAQQFPISRPAISQHLKVLSDAGLVAADPQGTRRVYRLQPDGLATLREYLDTLWDDALAAYAREAQRQSTKGPFDA